MPKDFDPKRPDIMHATGVPSERASRKGLVLFFFVAAVVALVAVWLLR